MKSRFYIIIGFIGMLGLYSCSDYLQTEPYGAGTEETAWESQADVQDKLNAFGNTFAAREGTAGRGKIWFDNASDNMVTGRSSSEADKTKNFKMSASSGLDVSETWPQMYQLIRMANDVLEHVPDMDILDDDFKNNALGQAYFYRAFAYLWLAPYYGDDGVNGGLPIVTEDTPKDSLDQPRPGSVLDNYDMIIDDMNKAADLLPFFSNQDDEDYGRPHKVAAWAFATRAALYASQFDESYYQKVLDLTEKIEDQGNRELFDDGSDDPYAHLFTKENNFSSEYIYSILGNENEGPKYHGMSFQDGGFGIYNTWGYFQPTLELYNSYEDGDTRRDATIIYPGDTMSFVGHRIIWAVDPSSVSSTSGMTFGKFMSIFADEDAIGKDVSPNGNNQSNRLGQVLIRYADVLLMRAEALIWTKGEGNSEAIDILNQIRHRARLPENSHGTKDELKKERRHELAFEFMPSRHLDLVRWGDAEEVYSHPLHGVNTKLNDDGTIDEVEKIKIWDSRSFDPVINQVWPIPESEVADSDNLEQNEGY